MKCTVCGHENPAECEVCSRCGAVLSDEHAEADKTIVFSAAEVEVERKGEKVVIPIEEMKEEQPTLVVLKGPNRGDKYFIESDEVTLGRHPESDIFLSDITVSRNHAEIVKKRDGYVLRDAGSLNGTYLNGKQIEEAELADQDEIQIGKFKLMFLAER